MGEGEKKSVWSGNQILVIATLVGRLSQPLTPAIKAMPISFPDDRNRRLARINSPLVTFIPPQLEEILRPPTTTDLIELPSTQLAGFWPPLPRPALEPCELNLFLALRSNSFEPDGRH